MSDYKTRMADEYRQLATRADKLRTMLRKQADGTLDFEPTCPIELNGYQRSDADIAFDALNQLIAQEFAAVLAGRRYGNKPLEESSSIRYHAYLTARDKIWEALEEGGSE